MGFSVVMVEDEKHQQESLSLLLHQHPDVNLDGIATSVSEAKALLDAVRPDLVFMDVMLPPHTSFDLLQSMEKIPFDIIFTTSYEKYAVHAFRLSAIDYLMKPVSAAELASALDKFRQKRNTSADQIRNLLSNLAMQVNPRIALPTLTGFLYVPVKEVIRCESDNTYTTFHTVSRQKIIVSKTLKEVEQMLEPYRFYRVHNSHLINMEFITEYIKGEGGIVKMADGSHIDVSRRRKEEFLKQLR